MGSMRCMILTRYDNDYDTDEWISGYGSSGLCLNGEIGISIFGPSGYSGFNGNGEGQGDFIQSKTEDSSKGLQMSSVLEGQLTRLV
ncbi:hypothetical protein PV325_006236 [Microctonus aethiopoides]|nr:hypothetical protein PV325_006236 [Microctonus aethiopoides]